MHINRHIDFVSLAPLQESWNQLAAGVPFRRWEWVEAWWRHYGCHEDGQPKRDHELFVLTVWDDENQLVGVAPWYRMVSRSGARMIRFLGDGEVCSDYLTVLCRTENESAVTEALADWLTLCNQSGAATRHGVVEMNRNASADCRAAVAHFQNRTTDNRWDCLEFVGVAANDTPVNQLLAQLKTQGSVLHLTPAPNTWRVPLPGTWEEYLMVLSKPHRNRLRRADRTYFQTGVVQLHQVKTPEEVPKFFDIFVELHQKHWQRKGFPGCFASPPFQALHRELAARFFVDGLTTLTWLEMDGTPLAAEYRLHGDGLMYAYQCGIDPDRLDIRPGELGNMASIKNAIERGQKAYDFLRGDERYKSYWRAKPHPVFTIRVVPRHVSARLRHNAWLAKQNLKRWIKSGLQLAGARKSESKSRKHEAIEKEEAST